MAEEYKRTNINQSTLETRYKGTKCIKSNFTGIQQEETEESKTSFLKKRWWSIYYFVPQTSPKGEASSASWGNSWESRLRAGRAGFTSAVRHGEHSLGRCQKLQEAISKARTPTGHRRKPEGWRQANAAPASVEERAPTVCTGAIAQATATVRSTLALSKPEIPGRPTSGLLWRHITLIKSDWLIW